MKHPAFLLLAVLLFCCTGCRRTPGSCPQAMLKAMGCMAHHPDSALTLLRGMADSLDGWPEETRMHHRLLTLQAEDLLYLMPADDSLAAALVQYYESEGDAVRQVQACYLLGKVYMGMNDAPQALKAFRQALAVPSVGGEMKERIYNELAPLFSNQGLTDDAIQINQHLLDIYRVQGNRLGMAVAQRSAGRLFGQKARTDSASHYYQEACRSALSAQDSALYYGILAEWAGLQYEVEKNPEMVGILKEAAHRADIPDKSNIHFVLSRMYKDFGLMDSMACYSRKVTASGNVEKAYYSYMDLYEVEKQKRNPVKALEYMERAMSCRDLLQTISQREALAQINSLYHYQHISDENAVLKLNRAKQKTIILALVLLLVSVTFACFVVVSWQRKRSRRALERERTLKLLAEERYTRSRKVISDNERNMACLTRQLAKAQAENDQLKYGSLMVEMKKLQLQNEEILLLQDEQRQRIELFRGSDLYKLIQQASENDAILITEHDWEEVWKAMDAMYPSFNKHLDDVFPGIALQTRQLCWLTKMGIKPVGIARILKRTRQAITNTRSKLNKVIADSPLPETNFDDFIANLS